MSEKLLSLLSMPKRLENYDLSDPRQRENYEIAWKEALSSVPNSVRSRVRNCVESRSGKEIVHCYSAGECNLGQYCYAAANYWEKMSFGPGFSPTRIRDGGSGENDTGGGSSWSHGNFGSSEYS